ncbi:hypothetical protein Vi05172_g527 [Venturia inaequalis]|nr:hypothetical protein Vi05172_g527 [Venturia inaequalis]
MAEFPYSKYRSETYNKRYQSNSNSDSNIDNSENEEAES